LSNSAARETTDYAALFEPLRIGQCHVRNRFVQPAHSKLYSEHGRDTQRDVDYYVARAKGGVALLITGERLVHASSPTGRPRFAYPTLRDAIQTDRVLTGAVHDHGAAIFAQLNHVGVEGGSDGADDLRALWGPSELGSPMLGETAHEMDPDDIRVVIDAWAVAAEISRDAGFDGVELHAAHGYLLSQFLSPLYNHRRDGWGGSLENRVRLTREVVDAIRARVGSDFVVGIRLGLTEFVEGGLEIEDASRAARLLVAGGGIDFINTSAGGYHSGQHRLIAPSDVASGWLIERVAHLRRSVPDVPIFAVGSLDDIEVAHDVVASGTADMVAITRGLIADPELPNKLAEGRTVEIARCIRGNQGCISRVWRGLPMGCTVNPEAGRERFFARRKARAASARRWIVVGGGPAGMKAAATLALRGHEVVLTEREEALGGQINLIARTPGRRSFGVLVEDLTAELEREGVELRLGVEATAADVHDGGFDHVVVATGASPDRSGYSSVAPSVVELSGARGPNVFTQADVIRDPSAFRGHVVVLDDEGTRATAGVAEALLDAGCGVRLVTRWTSLLPFTATTLDQPLLYERLLGKGMEYDLNTWASVIGRDFVSLYNLYTHEPSRVPEVDAVVLMTGRRSETALFRALRDAGLSPVRVGDCLAPRTIDHAIYDGYVAGLELDEDERVIPEGELEEWVVSA
jgi:2,4-dienoyl-CoA reductase-like NADH-dependent reductase (Old Yellow Enzyme family)/thioredoxin reductase